MRWRVARSPRAASRYSPRYAPRLAVLSVVAGVAFAFPACSSDEPDQADAAPVSSTTEATTTTEFIAVPPSRAPETTTTTSTTTSTTTTVPASTCDDQSSRPEIELQAVDDAFEPACVAATDQQGFKVLNTGTRVHNVSIEGLSDFGDLQPGERFATEAFSGEGGPGPGVYVLFCKFHRGSGMEAELRISPT